MNERAMNWLREVDKRLEASTLVTPTANLREARRLLGMAINDLEPPLDSTWTMDDVLQSEG